MLVYRIRIMDKDYIEGSRNGITDLDHVSGLWIRIVDLDPDYGTGSCMGINIAD